ncbi:MAG: nucleotidyl transferase AbiEii/AbiGii toxin family protein [Thermoplasmataceae archaeon]
MTNSSIEREMSVLNFLVKWPWEKDGILIGGYAISYYGKPRYSNDVDIVISNDNLPSIKQWLYDEGFALQKQATPNPQNYSGKVFRYEREEITLDILSGAVRDRDAKVDISATWLMRNKVEDILITKESSTHRKIMIASLEAIWALKIQSGREQDISDLFTLYQKPVNTLEVRNLFLKLWSESLENKLRVVVKKLESQKLFEDSMSRINEKRDKNLTKWKNFKDKFNSMIPIVF